MNKQCSNCGETKPIIEFSRNKDSKNGFVNPCKKCRALYYKNWRKNNLTKKRIHDRGYAKFYFSKNKNEIKIKKLRREKFQRENLHDTYIKNLIRKHSNLKCKDISGEMIAGKRVSIILRSLKKNPQDLRLYSIAVNDLKQLKKERLKKKERVK